MRDLSKDKQAMRSRMLLRSEACHWYKRNGLPIPATPKETALMERRYKHYLASLDPAKDKEPANIAVLIRQRNDQVSNKKKIRLK